MCCYQKIINFRVLTVTPLRVWLHHTTPTLIIFLDVPRLYLLIIYTLSFYSDNGAVATMASSSNSSYHGSSRDTPASFLEDEEEDEDEDDEDFDDDDED